MRTLLMVGLATAAMLSPSFADTNWFCAMRRTDNLGPALVKFIIRGNELVDTELSESVVKYTGKTDGFTTLQIVLDEPTLLTAIGYAGVSARDAHSRVVMLDKTSGRLTDDLLSLYGQGKRTVGECKSG